LNLHRFFPVHKTKGHRLVHPADGTFNSKTLHGVLGRACNGHANENAALNEDKHQTRKTII